MTLVDDGYLYNQLLCTIISCHSDGNWSNLRETAIKGSCGGLNQVGLSGSCSGGCSSEEKVICASKNAAQDE